MIPKAHFPASQEIFPHQYANNAGLYHVALEEEEVPEGWKICRYFRASPISTRDIYGLFLWNEVPGAIYQILLARRLGPNLALWCPDERYEHVIILIQKT